MIGEKEEVVNEEQLSRGERAAGGCEEKGGEREEVVMEGVTEGGD